MVEESVFTLKNLSFEFQGKKLDRLSLASISIWNGGKEVINHDDVASSDPIRIEIAEPNDILDAIIFESNEKSNKFSIDIAKNRKSVLIGFEYFHYMQGIILRIYHTGPAIDIFEVKGTIKQAGIIKFKGLADDYNYISLPYVYIARKMGFKKYKRSLYYIIMAITLPIMIVKTFRRVMKRGRNRFIIDDNIS